MPEGILPPRGRRGMAKCPALSFTVQSRSGRSARPARAWARGPREFVRGSHAGTATSPSILETLTMIKSKLGLQGASLVTALLCVVARPAAAQEFTAPRPSPNARVAQTVGITELSVTY